MIVSKQFFRIMLGRKSVYAQECYNGSFIGCDFGMQIDFTDKLSENWRDFNKEFRPVYLKNRPNKTKTAAGLACGAIWTISKGINIGDVVLCPNGEGSYLVGEVTGSYSYHPNDILPHRRAVKWFAETIDRNDMSQTLKNSTGSVGTVANITKFSKELEELLDGNEPSKIIATDDSIEDPSVFELEEHLESFLVENWNQTELGEKYSILEDDNDELAGRQFRTDTGLIDILAISKDKKEFLVIELKKGRASDKVVGQIQRYMGFVKEELAEEGQTVKGVIIALEDDTRIKRALAVTQNIEFYTYKVDFKLSKSK